MEQQTADWHEWRAKGIGSSEAAIIMGCSPYRTPFQLWEEKTGRKKRDDQANWAMQRGIDLEPKARAFYELMRGIAMPPALLVHPCFSYVRASADGFNAEAMRGVEIKFQGKEAHQRALDRELALDDRIAPHYRWQMDHQMACAEAEAWDFVSFNPESSPKGAIIEVEREPARIERLLEAEHAFWKLVESDTPPPLTERDFKRIRDKETVALFDAYRALQAVVKSAEGKMAEIKKQITERVKDDRAICAGMKFVRSSRAGSVDWDKLIKEHAPQVDKEQYRKKASVVVTISSAEDGE
jgi:putative phage-type endonuclease